ncbi:MAG: GspH/FimT family pseudopilin [Deltaproteobacteria bacterium]|jgi:prepilin-type N-terminal cleavage/methylation domain-containing protein
MRKAEGLTLVELMVAIAILAIFATVAIPSFNYYLPKARASGAGRELFTELQWARQRAIARNNDFVIVFNTSNDSYTIYDDQDNDFSTVGAESGEEVKTIHIGDHFKGIGFGYIAGNNPSGNPITGEVTFAGDNFTFRATGLANKSGAVYLIPRDDLGTSRKDRQRAITVLVSGRVRLYAHNGTTWQ